MTDDLTPPHWNTDPEDWGTIPPYILNRGRVISEDTIDSFALSLYDYLQTNPWWIEDEDEGFSEFKNYVQTLFENYWSDYIKERNYN